MFSTLNYTFLATCFLFSISPGAGAISTMSHSMSCGFRRSFLNIIGLQTALLIHMIIVGLGLGALIASSLSAFIVLKILGAGYLIFLGIQKWLEKPSLEITPNSSDQISGFTLFRRGLFVNLMNPKSIIFLAAFLPQFLIPGESQIIQLLKLGMMVIIVDLIVMIAYAVLANQVRTKLVSPTRIRLQNRIFGSLYIGAGILLGTAKRHA